MKRDSCAPKYITKIVFGENVPLRKPDVPETTTLACFKEIFRLINDTIGQKRGGFTYKTSLGTANSMNNHKAEMQKKRCQVQGEVTMV